MEKGDSETLFKTKKHNDWDFSVLDRTWESALLTGTLGNSDADGP